MAEFDAKNNYLISTNPSLLDLDLLYNFLSKDSYWAKDIPYDRFKKAVDNSICFGVYKDSFQVGFARVVSDMGTFAYLCDVFILPEHRGIGLSKMLIQTIRCHTDLLSIRRWLLITADTHLLYSQFGFTSLVQPKNWMEIFTPYS